MRTSQLPRHFKPPLVETGFGDAPPRLVEYAYYAVLFYGMFSVTWGLNFPLLGAGTFIVLAAYCVMRLGSRAINVYAAITFPVCCAISFLAIQVAFHDESLMEQSLREFIIWTSSLILLQSISLRQGFLRRFAFAMFIIGILALPYLNAQGGGLGVERASVDGTVGGNLGNANGLGEWFGFLSVYFIIAGIEMKGNTGRIGSWVAAAGCLFIVGLTVSRGTLLAVTIASVIAFRRLLERGFLPVLLLTMLIWFLYQSGLFDSILLSYAARGTEETGRLVTWPLAFERFLDSPVLGVGASNIKTYVPGARNELTPHNSFLFFALASGVIPLAFFVAYWWRAALGAFRSSADRSADAPFRIPLLIFLFLASCAGDTTFMAAWAIVTLSNATPLAIPRPGHRIVVRRFTKYGAAGVR